MLAATIVPQSYLPLIIDQPYHLALAHLIDKPEFSLYTAFYREMGYNENRFLIMDNGLIEGDPRPIEELVQKAHMLNADELVLPDVFQDAAATVKTTYSALGFCRREAPDLKVMAVPQGATYKEWLSCAQEMLEWGVDTIGIPKVVTQMAGRDGRCSALFDLQPYLRKQTQVHLLGCWETPLEIKVIENAIRERDIKPVRGVDSAIAYVYARAGLKMSDAERPSGAVDFRDMGADVGLLMYNIEMWQSECATLPSIKNGHKLFRMW